MKKMTFVSALTTSVLMLAGSAMAGFGTPTVDGTKDAAYGTALSVQTVQTQFGDGSGPLIGGGGSEFDGLYIANDATNLYVFLAGNVEANFNSAIVLIDTPTGGATTGPTIAAGSNEQHFDANGLAGAIFPAGFTPNEAFVSKAGGSSLKVAFLRYDLVASTFEKTAADVDTGDTVNPAIADAGVTAGTTTYGWALDNSNTLGVTGGTAAHTTPDPAAVTTGLELAIPLTALDSVTAGDSIKIIAGVISGDGTFYANQFLPAQTSPTGNVGGGNLGGVANAGGVMDFTIAPFAGYAPASYTLATSGPVASVDTAWTVYE